MQTDTLYAFQLENGGDFIVTNDGSIVTSISKDDEGDNIVVQGVDVEGDKVELTFGPFDTVQIVTSFEDEEIDIDTELYQG